MTSMIMILGTIKIIGNNNNKNNSGSSNNEYDTYNTKIK